LFQIPADCAVLSYANPEALMPDAPSSAAPRGAAHLALAGAHRSPAIGFGTAAIGHLYDPVTDLQARRALEAAWQSGVRYFDTAPLYGSGLAERRLGRFLAEHPRDEYVVSTKVGRLVDEPAAAGHTPPYGYSRAAVQRSLEGSLTRLGLDRIDIALVHDPDHHWEQAAREAIPELIRLRDEGTLRAIGAGMNQAPMLHRFVAETDIDCVLVAGRYTLLDRNAAETLLPACIQRGVAVIAGGIFNGGILADPAPGAHFDYRPASASTLARARLLRDICAGYRVPLAAAALQFSAGHPAVTAVLTGARSAAEVRENARLLDLAIPAELWDTIETAISGQAGAADRYLTGDGRGP
jgi:D-threo-aldose 1-dehydrogenase